MFWAFWGSFFVLVVVTSNTHSVASGKCEIKKKDGVFYSLKASQSHGKILKRINSSNESECRKSCCGSSRCTLYMYSTVLHEYHHNFTCFLIFCGNNSLCLTKLLPKNVTGISVVGIKQDRIGNISMVNSNSKNVTIDQLKVHSSPPSSTLSRIPPGINTTIHHTSSEKETTMLNSTVVEQLTTHSGINTLTGSPPSTLQSQPTTSLNHTPSVFPRRPVLSSSHQAGLLNGSHYNSSLDNSINHKTHSLVNTSHSFSPLHSNSSALSLKVMNSPKVSPLSNVNLTSFLSPSAFANLNISSTVSKTAILKTDNSTLGILSKSPSDTLGKSQASTFSPSSPTTSHAAISSVKQNPRKKFSESRSHTTPASLVISLIIGILFFGTVVFLIGRRWGETCFRRGYSRVDYLLNDYD